MTKPNATQQRTLSDSFKSNGFLCWTRNQAITLLNYSAIQLSDGITHGVFAFGQRVTPYHLDNFRALQVELGNIETCSLLALNIPYRRERL